MHDYEIIESVAQTIIKTNKDLIMDFSDIGLDLLIDENVIKEIPFVKTAYSIVKSGIAIRDRHFMKKTLQFIIELNNNNLKNEEYDNYKQKLLSNDKILYKELEYILVIIDRIIDIKKTKILANLYTNYINKKILWEDFEELSQIIDDFYIKDIGVLEKAFNSKKFQRQDIQNLTSLYRLKSQSLIHNIESTNRDSNGHIGFYFQQYDYQLSELGDKLFKYGIM